jgi:deoxyribodipyrimidine photolyase-related protein
MSQKLNFETVSMLHVRSMVIVLGDQLDMQAAAFDGFDASQDMVWMAEVSEESTHVWSSKQRTALFLSSMRHFAQSLKNTGKSVHYQTMTVRSQPSSLALELQAAIEAIKPLQLVMTAPGDWRVLKSIQALAQQSGLPLEVRKDRHFFTTVQEFSAHAQGRKTLRLEYFYRELRRHHQILMEGDQPAGGQWNFDVDNRKSFGAQGPGRLPERVQFAPDTMTCEVIDLVNEKFKNHPGTLDSFAWPVTREQALQSLARFIQERLPLFGQFEDAMWAGEPWLYHSHLSAALNLKLLSPHEVVHAAQAAWQAGHAPLASVEGFIRQILGWREYVRGLYWTQMPQYLECNALGATENLPAWYWTGQTDMACLRDAITQTLAHGYAHHIQRLMVTGLFALLLGVDPKQVHAWYLAVYVDAVEWVCLPNTLAMGQYADGGQMASKPYIATGKYIERMGNQCKSCRYQPGEKLGATACPFTTLYWDFLMRHEPMLSKNPRMALQVKNLKRLSDEEKNAVAFRAQAVRTGEVGLARD